MFLFVIGLLLLVAAVVAYFSQRALKRSITRLETEADNRRDIQRLNDTKAGHTAAAIAKWVLGTIGVLLFVLSFVRVVPANSVGIPVTFGNIGSSMESGFHVTSPFTTVHSFSTRLQESSMLGDPKEGDRANDDSVDLRGSDDGVVYADVTIRYTVEKGTASALFKRVGSMEGIRDRIIRPDARSIIRDVAKQYSATDLVAEKRGAVEKESLDVLKKRMADNYGINIDSLLVRSVRPSEQVDRAIQVKLQKQQEAEQALIEQKKQQTEAETRQNVAKADAETAVRKAQGVADSVRITAQGEADANAKLAASLTPAILQKLQTEALKSGTVFVVPEGGNFILGDLTAKK